MSNQQEWERHYIENEYYNICEFTKNPASYQGGYFLWSTRMAGSAQDMIFNVARDEFQIDHGLTIINPEADYCDFYHFASSPENNNIENFYLNHKDLLHHFINRYHHIMDRELNESYHNLIAINPKHHHSAHSLTPWLDDEKITLISTYLGISRPNFSKRELECARYCKEGRTAQETAEILKISRRTVEAYLDKIKVKLNCQTKSEVIAKLNSENIIN